MGFPIRVTLVTNTVFFFFLFFPSSFFVFFFCFFCCTFQITLISSNVIEPTRVPVHSQICMYACVHVCDVCMCQAVELKKGKQSSGVKIPEGSFAIPDGVKFPPIALGKRGLARRGNKATLFAGVQDQVAMQKFTAHVCAALGLPGE